MSKTLTAPGRWLIAQSNSFQRAAEDVTRTALTNTEKLPKPLEWASDFAIGLMHGPTGMLSGVIRGAGAAEELMVSKDAWRRLATHVEDLFHHTPGGVAGSGASFFKKDPPYVIGDFLSAVIPAAVTLLATKGNLAAAAVAAVATVAAIECSPNLPSVLDSIPPKKF
jgi:hypothetical protein